MKPSLTSEVSGESWRTFLGTVGGVWLMFLPVFLSGSVMTLIDPASTWLTALPLLLLPGAILFKTTRNYLRYRRESPQDLPETTP